MRSGFFERFFEWAMGTVLIFACIGTLIVGISAVFHSMTLLVIGCGLVLCGGVITAAFQFWIIGSAVTKVCQFIKNSSPILKKYTHPGENDRLVAAGPIAAKSFLVPDKTGRVRAMRDDPRDGPVIGHSLSSARWGGELIEVCLYEKNSSPILKKP